MLQRTEHLTKRYGDPEAHRIDRYLKSGGYQQARKALAMTRDKVVAEVRAANLRGRGGASFPMGDKWGLMPKEPDPQRPHYLIVNADEGAPGTFKDRTIMERDPHAVVEGCIIGCYGVGAHTAYIHVREELHLAKQRLWDAIGEARKRGFLGPRPCGKSYPVNVVVHTGAGSHICGEESALLDSLEGKRREPSRRPPFPAEAGAFGMPSSVNNLESIASVPVIMELGGEAFSKLSELSELRDGGCRLFGVSGHVKTPGIYECAIGLTLRELIDDLGGGVDGGELLAVIPGGVSTPVLRADEVVDAPDSDDALHRWHGQSVLDVPMGVDTFRPLGTMVGTCCAIVLSERACPVRALHNIVRFFSHESCGQCTPCREGNPWLERILERIVAGEGSIEELDQIHDIAGNIMGNTICAFGDGSATAVLGFLQKFRREFEEHIRTGGQSSTGRLSL